MEAALRYLDNYILIQDLDEADKEVVEMKEGFIVPPKHVHFEAKKLFGSMGAIIDGSIAYLSQNGGGPTEQHTHEHNHLFIVTEGEAKVLLGNEEVIIKKDESFLVEGKIPHSVWNNIDGTTVMIGISVK